MCSGCTLIEVVHAVTGHLHAICLSGHQLAGEAEEEEEAAAAAREAADSSESRTSLLCINEIA